MYMGVSEKLIASTYTDDAWYCLFLATNSTLYLMSFIVSGQLQASKGNLYLQFSSQAYEFGGSLTVFSTMCPGYFVEVTSLSPKATEKDVYDFFAHCGAIQHVEIIRSGEYACTAYVTFIDGYALQTAVLLSGAMIVDQQVCITPWILYMDDSDPWKVQDNVGSLQGIHVSQFVSTPGEAITVAQEVVKTMLAKGYVLGKDALVRAKAFDESHRVSATATAKVAEISKNIGLTDKINAGMETVKYVDEKYHVLKITKSTASVTGTAAVAVATFTGKTAMAAGHAFVNSSYFAKGAFWVSDVLTRAAQAAADLGNKAGK